MSLPPATVIVNRVLIVDDDRDQSEALKKILESERYTVEIAKDSGQAHTAFTMHHPDCVLLDIILPHNVSGFEVCERMKKTNEDIPVIILTAIDMDDARDLARRVGADDYITKPYDPRELLDRIRETADQVWSRKHSIESSSTSQGGKVRFMCGECGKHMKASLEHRGRTLNCPKCGQPVVVPLHA